MASALSRRLGKRSLLGARVLGPPGTAPSLEPQVEVPEEAPTTKDVPCPEQPREALQTAGPAGLPPTALQPGQKVTVWHGAPGLLEHSWAEEPVTAGLAERRPLGRGRAQEVRAAEAQAPPEPGPQTPVYRPVSRNIDVPKRKSDAVEMDEMMAAMVLTSLSCSPVLQSPPGAEASFSVSRAACDPWKESGDVSDSGSSTTSGHWSGSSGISTPSPPHPQASPKYLGDAFGSPQTDAGFETDPDAFLLDEPAPRKRKNSVKVMYKCLWPSCGKVLRSTVGIKRHVRTLHLGDTAGSDQFKREEDFYYTEVQAREGAAEPVPTPGGASAPLTLLPPPVPPSGPEQGSPEPRLPARTLSKSAPGSFWHIQADHAYQAVPSFQTPVSPHIYTSVSWAAPSTAASLSPGRSRSLSFSEPQPPPPAVKSHLIVTSPPRTQSSARKGRGEAKKCRKVYGVEQRAQWCTACRWKKACQRFLD